MPRVPVPSQAERWQHLLRDHDGDEAAAARAMISLVLGHRIAGLGEEALDDRLRQLYTLCDLQAKNRTEAEFYGVEAGDWVLSASRLCEELRAAGLTSWAAAYDRLAQGAPADIPTDSAQEAV